MTKEKETEGKWQLAKEDAEVLREYVLRTARNNAAFADAARAWGRRAGGVIGERVRAHVIDAWRRPITKEVLLVELVEMFQVEFVWYGGEDWYRSAWDAMLNRESCWRRATALVEDVLAALVDMGVLAMRPVPPEEEVVGDEIYVVPGPALQSAQNE